MSLHNEFGDGEPGRSARRPQSPEGSGRVALVASTDEVEPSGRFDYWRHVLADGFGGSELRRHANGVEPFTARLRGVCLGEVTLSRISGCAADVVRPRPSTEQRSSGAARFHVEIPLRGTSRLAQDGRETLLRPGDFALCDNTLPFRYGFPSFYDELVIQVPGETLLGREPRAGALTAVAVRGDAGLGSLLSLVLRKVAELEQWRESPLASVFAAQLVDLVVTALSAQLGPPDRRVARSRYLADAKAYLHDNLHDPALTPDRVARAVGISPRYLHMLFHEEGSTVTRWLAARRLERARALLASAHHRSRTVTEIATSVGFSDLSHFSASFKAAFAVSPRTYREQAAGD